MFEQIKEYFQSIAATANKGKKLPVIVTVHGYGRRRKHEMDNLVLWAKDDALLKQYEIIQFDLYDLFDESDCDWQKWVSRAKTKINEQELKGREIILIGFSMGGVIASYLAATSAHVKKLILLAPAFQYINMDAISSVITKSAAAWFSSDGKEEQVAEIELPKRFYNAFTEVVRQCKPYIEQVNCPVLILHGDSDEVISVKSSIYAYERIPHQYKKMIILHEGHHRLLMDEAVNWEVYQLMRLFINNQILSKQPIAQAPDILDIYRKERQLAQSDDTSQTRVNASAHHE
ncbi:MAG: alpha/beta fold hydrolase [Erysipelotrichaceae bacterium]|nr:alpha/beta fold hydrolase [Erysipelotrichaceae bacterium]